MNEFVKILLTGVSAAILTNFFGFWRDKKTIHSKYLEETLKELYIPLIREIGLGAKNDFTHLTKAQIDNIRTLLLNVPHLVDLNLSKLMKEFSSNYTKKEAFHTIPVDFKPEMKINLVSKKMELEDPITSHYSVDLKLKFEILKGYNTVKRSLGLPYDIKYVSFTLRVPYFLYTLGKQKVLKGIKTFKEK